jgi:hypothetical protein
MKKFKQFLYSLLVIPNRLTTSLAITKPLKLVGNIKVSGIITISHSNARMELHNMYIII